jgi:hypothetical protein
MIMDGSIITLGANRGQTGNTKGGAGIPTPPVHEEGKDTSFACEGKASAFTVYPGANKVKRSSQKSFLHER